MKMVIENVAYNVDDSVFTAERIATIEVLEGNEETTRGLLAVERQVCIDLLYLSDFTERLGMTLAGILKALALKAIADRGIVEIESLDKKGNEIYAKIFRSSRTRAEIIKDVNIRVRGINNGDYHIDKSVTQTIAEFVVRAKGKKAQ